ncbi:MAG: hypothetical protein JW749_02555 [Sedimentisphaerales bacterium]|nr:hypothetical protein [Sedimentisphaerales bacterium]
MKNIDYEKGLARMAWTFGIFGVIGLILFLLPYLPPQISFTIASPFFIMIFLLSFIASNPAGKIFIFLLGITIVFLLIRFFIKGFCSHALTKQQGSIAMKINRRIIISAIIIAIVGFGGSGLLGYKWYWQTHTGSRSGQVIDAITGKPIEGAVVKYSWKFSMLLGGALGSGSGIPAVSYETLSDKEGKYYIPNLRVKRKALYEMDLYPEEVLIYKDGYAVYRAILKYFKSPILKPLGYPTVEQIYSKKNNIAKLYPWKDGESHEKHLELVDEWTFPSKENELLLKELELEKIRAEQERTEKQRQK